MRKIERISVSATDRERLERLVRDRNTPQKLVWRARIVLLASDGLTAEGIAAAVGKSLLTVRRWRRRYVAKGVDGLLKDATRRSRVKPLTPEKIKQVVDMTLHETPPNATHWSVRSMAKAAGISHSSVQRIWHAHGLKPHLVDTFKVSRDKNFAAKVEDVVGLYLNPPDKAMVLCVDEKSQIQALDRTQPGLPMKKGRAGTMTHDYKRNGTTTLFAALSMLDGKVIGTCMPRHRHREFLRFLKLIDQRTPAGLDLHRIAMLGHVVLGREGEYVALGACGARENVDLDAAPAHVARNLNVVAICHQQSAAFCLYRHNTSLLQSKSFRALTRNAG